ncbi:hypothetical protein Rumeso_00336 [Rubellimicrobium mesophilum DSM 19309]|uniref:Uncharacterized protein n=2 Tax=Rubellimicrobium TaxID=295418 RepID=A0A017HWG9_9RHOB|nr:hypothetical protein Rumeso_00336 [Rubellimicrobium mesophilum DSM 19309]
MTPDWQAKAEAFTAAVGDVEAMVATAEATTDLAHEDAIRLKRSTEGIVEAVDGLISRLKQNGADPNFTWTLASLLRTLRSADRRAAKLVRQASDTINGVAGAQVEAAPAPAKARAPRRPWFPGRLGDFPGKPRLAGDGAYGLEVVVEAFSQDVLDALFGPRTNEMGGGDTFCVGELLPEDRDIYSAGAVAVYVSSLKVGSLSRDDARHFREAAARAGIAGQSVDVDLLVTKGWRRRDGEEGPYRVSLDARLPFEFGSRSDRGAQTA